MLGIVVQWRTRFFFFLLQKGSLQTARFIFGGSLVYSGWNSVYFWYVVLDASMLACDFLHCALYMHTCSVCMYEKNVLFDLRPNKSFFFFCKTGLLLQWSNSCDYSLSTGVPKHLPFYYFEIEESHTLSRYIVLCLSISQLLLFYSWTVCFLWSEPCGESRISCCQCSCFHFPQIT